MPLFYAHNHAVVVGTYAALNNGFAELRFMNKDSEKKPGKSAFDPKDLVDERIPCVYGPPEWYDSHGNLDNNHPSARRFKERIREIEERNRQRRIQREMEAQDCDEPIADVYGPMTPMPWENHTIPKEEEKDEDKKEEKEEDTGVIRGFFAQIFGKKHS